MIVTTDSARLSQLNRAALPRDATSNAHPPTQNKARSFLNKQGVEIGFRFLIVEQEFTLETSERISCIFTCQIDDASVRKTTSVIAWRDSEVSTVWRVESFAYLILNSYHCFIQFMNQQTSIWL